jgi:hypothetical protein
MQHSFLLNRSRYCVIGRDCIHFKAEKWKLLKFYAGPIFPFWMTTKLPCGTNNANKFVFSGYNHGTYFCFMNKYSFFPCGVSRVVLIRFRNSFLVHSPCNSIYVFMSSIKQDKNGILIMNTEDLFNTHMAAMSKIRLINQKQDKIVVSISFMNRIELITLSNYKIITMISAKEAR